MIDMSICMHKTYSDKKKLNFSNNFFDFENFWFLFLTYFNLLGGYVAADITALMAEVSKLCISTSLNNYRGHDNHDKYKNIDKNNDNDDNSNLNSKINNKKKNSINEININYTENDKMNSEEAVNSLLVCFRQAMTVIGPSCLRGIGNKLIFINMYIYMHIYYMHIYVCINVYVYICVYSYIHIHTYIGIKLPDLNYNDVIGYDDIKKSLRRILSFSSPQMLARVKRYL
jgi:hypothetical protein